MSLSIIMLDGLIAGIEAGSDIPVQKSELVGLKTILISELADLRARLEKEEKDAERHDFMRNHLNLRIDCYKNKFRITDVFAQIVISDWFDTYDAAIDAAIAKERTC